MFNNKKGNLTFVLSASGHIAGIVNPASRDRRNYWLNDNIKVDADTWLEGAASVQGSWWKHWSAWAAKHSGKKVPARNHPGSKAHPVIEPAPGRYVRAKAPPGAA